MILASDQRFQKHMIFIMQLRDTFHAIEVLPQEAQLLVADFVEMLRARNPRGSATPKVQNGSASFQRDEHLRSFVGCISAHSDTNNEAIDADLARAYEGIIT